MTSSDTATKCRAKDPATCKYHANISKMWDAIAAWDFDTYATARREMEAARDTADIGLFAKEASKSLRKARDKEVGRLDEVFDFQVAVKTREAIEKMAIS